MLRWHLVLVKLASLLHCCFCTVISIKDFFFYLLPEHDSEKKQDCTLLVFKYIFFFFKFGVKVYFSISCFYFVLCYLFIAV